MSTKTARRAKCGTETLLVGTQLYLYRTNAIMCLRAHGVCQKRPRRAFLPISLLTHTFSSAASLFSFFLMFMEDLDLFMYDNLYNMCMLICDISAVYF